MRFPYATILVLGSISGSDAFLTSNIIRDGTRRTTEIGNRRATTNKQRNGYTVSVSMSDEYSDDFLDALSLGKKNSKGSNAANDHDEEEDEASEGSGGSRFKELLKAARQGGAAEEQRLFPSAIENPFLNPPPPPPGTATSPPLPNPSPFQPLANLDDLSVEEQARMFREMLANQQQQPLQGATAPLPVTPVAADIPTAQRVSKTDRAGRPVGRNRDADTISNTSDLYFAQLKRDSSVRTMARIRGEDDVAEKVFEDEGIKQLDELLVKNPYLKGQNDKEKDLFDTIPEEALAPYFKSSEVSEQEKVKAGPSYKKKLMERRQKKGEPSTVTSHDSAATTSMFKQQIEEVTLPDNLDATVVESSSVSQQIIDNKAPPPQLQKDEEELSQVPHQQQASSPSSATISGSEESRQKIRTLMGLILKHRGGPGFGKGRLKGPEIDRFENLLKEVTDLLKQEAKDGQSPEQSLANNVPSADSVTGPSPTHAAPVSSSTAKASAAETGVVNIDNTIACIEGAITMYKNSPPELQQSVLVALRAALVSAVNTCNQVLVSQPPPSITGNSGGKIDSTIAVIEGAITMYRNSPPELQESVLVTLRAALLSAAETCSAVLDPNTAAPPPPPSAAHASLASTPFRKSDSTTDGKPLTSTTTVGSQPMQVVSPTGIDRNSEALEDIYQNVKAASGDGRLGIRSDLSPAEANELADQLVEMRSILMEELEGGISEAGIAGPEGVGVSSLSDKSSSASKYQQMLAKARAEKR